ncbi:hypothetical protein K466DRAFT_553176 [Polyporus arcularius HHB13444]|uniref:Uncharacterized protein n=1 Tax=Polyporus arcularius HHB13444 TaxID=1314778 RepID=A0A5C3P4W0_9APHY|nr:hypothetical protein K466DRAFT_553176 [Polyporus arcularius HHB13444]
MTRQLLFPDPLQFAVIRIDARAMVEPLEDPIALEAAAMVKCRKYLVFLEAALDLPGPHSRWCRYSAYPVASALRPSEPELGITPDMVMPIAPNETHAKGREPIGPEPAFPFDNCFFWIRSSMVVRIKRKDAAEFDDRRATRLGVREHVALLVSWRDDSRRIAHFVEERRRLAQSPSATGSPPSPASGNSSSAPAAPQPSPASSASTSLRRSASSDDDVGRAGNSRDIDHDDGASSVSTSSSDDLAAYNLFGWSADPALAFYPLLDAWLELEENITQSEIGNPADFYEEHEVIQR